MGLHQGATRRNPGKGVTTQRKLRALAASPMTEALNKPVLLVEVNQSVPVPPTAETNIEGTTSGPESYETETEETEDHSESTYSSDTPTPPRRERVRKPMPPAVSTVTDRRPPMAQESSDVPLAEAKQSVPLPPNASSPLPKTKTSSVTETSEIGEPSSTSFSLYTPSPPGRGNIRQPVAPTVHPVTERKAPVTVKSEMPELRKGH
ncbi:hypothetical protein GE09DRAFT_313206 [Coniochaeta sp. 2T2.1]|nr:hypothetical protein GE09DRAFT_313206 [Coniochaeta sp. 2T2.1]